MNKYYLCTIWKNESRALLEWIAFHRKLNFDQIHIFDNNSSDGSRDDLIALAKSGFIRHSVIDAVDAGKSPQVEAYRLAVSIARMEGFKWILFIDADEFIVPHTVDTIDELIGSITCGDESISAIGFNWKTFGSSGHKIYDERLTMDRFTRCAGGLRSPNNCVKSIVRIDRLNDPHIHIHKITSGKYINDAGQESIFYDNGMTRNGSFAHAQINHYMVKSYEEFVDKRAKGNANRHDASKDKYDRINDEYFKRFDINEEEDFKIARFRTTTLAEINNLKLALVSGE